jgi:hypothetical protein
MNTDFEWDGNLDEKFDFDLYYEQEKQKKELYIKWKNECEIARLKGQKRPPKPDILLTDEDKEDRKKEKRLRDHNKKELERIRKRFKA